jgi:hypothetical protein
MENEMKNPVVYVDGQNEPVKLPTRFEVCPQCEGRGTSSAYLGVFTASEWAEQDDDFKEDYIAGRYDRPCECCNGLRVIPVVDEDRCDPELLKEYQRQMDEEAHDREIERQERLMEGGWRELGWYSDY